MKTLRAVHTIHMTLKPGVAENKITGVKRVPPEVKELKPGTRFVAQSAEQEAELLAWGAAVVIDTTPEPEAAPVAPAPTSGKKPTKAEKAAAEAAAKAAEEAAAKTDAGADEDGDGDGEGDGDDEDEDLL